MRKLYLTLSFFSFAFIGNAQRKIDVLHYTYLITVNDQNDTISGFARIEFVALRSVDTVTFDLAAPNTAGKGMTVIDIMQLSPAFNYHLKFNQSKDHLNIPVLLNKNDTGKLVIRYKGIPADGLIISKNKYGDKTFFADNWPNRAHFWIPCVDEPSDKATVDLGVTAPIGYKVIANGRLFQEKINEVENTKTTLYKESAALPTKVMVIGVAKFAVKTYPDSPTGIPVSAWVYQQDSLPGFRNYSVAPSIVKFFIDYIGPYPYEKLANVQSKTIFGGMENASAIFYEETSAALYQNIETLLAHEIAHQWFGDMASEKSFPHLWLSEGFATYLTHIYIESKYGTDSLNNEMKRDRDAIIGFVKESNRPVVDSTSPLMSLLNANSYQKGGWVLHMLRRELSDTIFHKIIRSYYAAYAGKNADTRDFQKICEKESGKDLSVFFDQWLYSPGIPKLEVRWNYDADKKIIVVDTKQLQSKVFMIKLEIALQSSSGKAKAEMLDINRQSQQFLIPVNDKPLQVVLDPNTSLLFLGSVQPSN